MIVLESKSHFVALFFQIEIELFQRKNPKSSSLAKEPNHG